ncbi:MAG: exonuclease domain-containing protein [Anaerolineales bacterium]
MLDTAAPINRLPIAVVDVETTGLRPEIGDRICEIAVLRVETDGSRTVFDTLINPGRPIDPGASNVSGIYDEDVIDAPRFGDVAEHVAELLRETVLVAHNASFDLGFLQAEFAIARLEPPSPAVVDTLLLARNFFHFHSNTLGAVARSLHVKASGLHRAAADVDVTYDVFQKMAHRLNRDYGLQTLAEFLHAQAAEFSLRAPPPPPRLPDAIRAAVQSGGDVAIRYASGAATTERVVRPLWINAKYLIAHCHLRNAQRTFRLDRIEAAWHPEAGDERRK